MCLQMLTVGWAQTAQSTGKSATPRSSHIVFQKQRIGETPHFTPSPSWKPTYVPPEKRRVYRKRRITDTAEYTDEEIQQLIRQWEDEKKKRPPRVYRKEHIHPAPVQKNDQ